MVGFLLALAVVPATERLTALHRRVSGALLGEEIPSGTPTPTGTDAGHPTAALAARPGALARRRLPVVLGDRRVRDVAAAGRAAGRAGRPPRRRVTRRRPVWWLLSLLVGPLLVAWWCVDAGTGPRPGPRRPQHPRHAPGRAARAPGRGGRRPRAPRRSTTRPPRYAGSSATCTTAPRPGSPRSGMNVGLAEKLIDAPTRTRPPRCCARPGRPRCGALEDLRSVVRGIHPPALADRGLAGGVEALALPIPMPITVTVDVPGRCRRPSSPRPTSRSPSAWPTSVKHADAARAWVASRHDGDGAAAGRRRRRPGRRRPGRHAAWRGWPTGSRPSTAR